MHEETIVCRCEDVTLNEVLESIEEGYVDLEELRKKLRIGMGACQGRVCIHLLTKILEEKTGVSGVSLPTSRPPIVPVPLGLLAGDD
jgi:NAD(P)H-nitrite reductase large subunit